MSALMHYLTLTLRIFSRSPFATGVNVLTLAAGLFCFLTAYAFVTFWNGAERHFPNAERIQVLTTTFRFPGFESRADTTGPTRAAAQLRIDFPELESVARATVIDARTIVSANGSAIRAHAVAVDPEFLSMFALPFVSGDPLRALDTPRSAVLTRETARRLFGAGDPVGRSVRIDNRLDVAVTGLINAVPEPSHFGRSTSASLPFEVLVSHDVRDTLAGGSNSDEPGWDLASTTYLLLPRDEGLTAAVVEARLDGFAERHIPAPDLAQAGAEIEFGVVPVTHLLRKGIDESLFPEGATISVSAVLLALGGLVLAVACVNYATLATAAAVRRVREAGVRKTLGAAPSQVMTQHLLEAALLSVLALFAAIGLFRAAAPLLAPLIGADPWQTLFAGPYTYMILVIIVACVTAAAGAYPAFVVSRVLPLDALRASRLRIGPNRLTASLVGAQFTVASLLLIGVTLTWLQNAELARTGLGTANDPLIVIENPNGSNHVDQETLRSELARIPQVLGVTDTGSEPWLGVGAITLSATPDGTTPVIFTFRREVGRDFFSVFDVELLAGRALSPDRAEDQPVFSVDRPYNAVVDRIFVEQFGFASPEDAIGKLVYFPAPDGRALLNQIVGVAETVRWDFSSIGGASSTVYRLSPNNEYTVVRVAGDDVAGALQRIDAAWRGLAPNVPIEWRFLDDVFQQAYETFARINQVVTFLALIAVAIATAGLVGMAALVTSRRVREIAVRKVHGARTGQMVVMLLTSFTKPVVVAALLAWPIAYVAGRAYLGMFAYSIPLTPIPFLFCLAVTLAIAYMAVAAQTLRAARTRPAEMLRTD
ncbi:MAG TPA: ABC transporter permease [Gammaproteobacteria bacterium]